MNYKSIYYSLIEKRKEHIINKSTEIYTELHHIKPKSLGGSHDKENLIRLTAREHFVAHALLAGMFEKETLNWYKMNHAFLMLKAGGETHNRYFNSRLYEAKRKDFSKTMSWYQTGSKNSQFGTVWMYNVELNIIQKVQKNCIQEHLDLGWNHGRLMLKNGESVYECLERKKIKKIMKVLENKKIKARQENKKIDTYITKYFNNYFSCLDRELEKIAFTYNDIHFTTITRNILTKMFNIDIRQEHNFHNISKIHKILNSLYIFEKMSSTDLANKFNTNNRTIINYLKMFNIKMRTIKESKNI